MCACVRTSLNTLCGNLMSCNPWGWLRPNWRIFRDFRHTVIKSNNVMESAGRVHVRQPPTPRNHVRRLSAGVPLQNQNRENLAGSDAATQPQSVAGCRKKYICILYLKKNEYNQIICIIFVIFSKIRQQSDEWLSVA